MTIGPALAATALQAAAREGFGLGRYPLAAFGKSACPSCGMRAPVDKDHAAECPRRPLDRERGFGPLLVGPDLEAAHNVSLMMQEAVRYATPPTASERRAALSASLSTAAATDANPYIYFRWRRWRDDPNVSLLCSSCGAEFPEPCAPDCARPPDTIAIVLAAVTGGATLMLTGPDLLSGERSIAATLESSSGASYASVEGQSIGPVLVELARRWLLQRGPGEQVGHDPEREQQQAANEPTRAADLEQSRETAAPVAPGHIKPSRTR